MKGTIEIKVIGVRDIAVHRKMSAMTGFDKAIIMDALARALELDESDRLTIGALIAVGGFGTLSGVAPEQVRIDMDQINKMRKKGNTQNETDAL